MNCIYCPEGATRCRWCNPPAPARGSLAERFPGAKPTQQDRARRGLHPMGHPMPALCELTAAETCGSCAHRQRGQNDSGKKSWSKCALAAQSHGTATDTRAGWPACARWAPEPVAVRVEPTVRPQAPGETEAEYIRAHPWRAP